jgi:glycosyltransferase involved in cell wall biosynthesis
LLNLLAARDAPAGSNLESDDRMIGIAHGYGLGGSGSNLWTREAVSALCTNGETVHLMCQESRPERFDFVTEFRVYDADGRPEVRFRRPASRAGACIVHKPTLDLLPTYVRPGTPSQYVRSILDMTGDEIEGYVRRNLQALQRISNEGGVTAWHVNHTVLLSEAFRRLRQTTGIPFAVMPHGSALEYVVRHDERMQAVARDVLSEANRIFSLNQEIRDRLARYFPDLDLEPRTVTVRVGVDTDRFRPVPRSERAVAVDALARDLDSAPEGRSARHADALAAALDAASSHEAFQAALGPATGYEAGPDQDIVSRLRNIDWGRERVVAFVGRLIPAKGVAALVAAFPLILERHPDTRLVLVGAGWLREYLEAYVLALRTGRTHSARQLLQWAAERDTEQARPSGTGFLQHLEDSGRIEAYFQSARTLLSDERIVFTGFLEHHLLAHVFPLADVAVFPSAVAEASPLVIPEAAACGCLPMGTDFAGMSHSLHSLDPHVPPALRDLMRLRPEPQHTGQDIARNVIAALDTDMDVATTLRRAALEEYDWRRIAGVMARELRGLSRSPLPPVRHATTGNG